MIQWLTVGACVGGACMILTPSSVRQVFASALLALAIVVAVKGI